MAFHRNYTTQTRFERCSPCCSGHSLWSSVVTLFTGITFWIMVAHTVTCVNFRLPQREMFFFLYHNYSCIQISKHKLPFDPSTDFFFLISCHFFPSFLVSSSLWLNILILHHSVFIFPVNFNINVPSVSWFCQFHTTFVIFLLIALTSLRFEFL